MFHLKNIQYRYVRDTDGEATAARIRGIEIDDLEIARDGVTAVIGPSGSGKTTLLSILAGFLKSTPRGTGSACHFDGQDYSKHGHAVGDVSFVFQSPMLLGAANAAVNMLQGRAVAPGAVELDDGEINWIRHRSADLGLLAHGDHLLAKRASNLSGGEKQRVAILRALIANPKAILCDEPTSSLDEYNAKQALDALKNWSKERKRPVIWVTHNMEQAAGWADHYVFMSRGRIYQPSDDQQIRLGSLDPDVRLGALREVVATLSNGKNISSDALEGRPGQAPIRLGRPRYAGWIAHALSTDASSGGLSSIDGDKGGKMPAWPMLQMRLLQRLDNTTPEVSSRVDRAWRMFIGYTHYGTAFIVLVLMLQIFAAFLGNGLARDYSDRRLQDPSVARVVFDHFVFGQVGNGRRQPPELYPGAPMKALEADLRAEIAKRAPAADVSRVALFGRRVVDGSALQFKSGNAYCAENWYPSANDTVALSIDDPILNQTELAAGDPRLQPDLSAVRHRAKTLSPALGPKIPLVLVDLTLFGRLQERCEFAKDEPVHALWAVGDIGKLTPIEVEVAGAVTEFPPLYPLKPEILVFESGYQQAMNQLDAGSPGPFRVATAYIPIEGFEPATDVISRSGYRARDDSSAAVETLQGIARAANILPIWIIGFNIAAATFLFMIVLDHVLTFNKSVLALFVAHGYRVIDILMIMILHMLPALVAATLALALLFLAVSPFVQDLSPSTTADFIGIRNRSFGLTVLITMAVWLAITFIVVPTWWRKTRSRLKTYLQE